MQKILIQNALAIVCCDAEDTVLENCDILIHHNEIIKIATNIPVTDAKVIDATNKILYPGLINTHHHLFQSFVRNQKSIDSQI